MDTIGLYVYFYVLRFEAKIKRTKVSSSLIDQLEWKKFGPKHLTQIPRLSKKEVEGKGFKQPSNMTLKGANSVH